MTSAFRLLRARLRARLKYMRATGRLRRVVLLLTGGVLLLGIVWIAVTGYFARSQEDELQTGLRQVKALVSSGQIEEARQVADGLPALATRAHRLTTGPAWWIASEIPYLGDPFKVVRGSTDAVQEVGTHGVPALLQVAASLDPKKLRTAGASIDTAPLVAAAPELATAAQSLDAARAEVDKLPHSTWLSAVNGPRQTLAAQLKSIGDYVDAAARAAAST